MRQQPSWENWKGIIWVVSLFVPILFISYNFWSRRRISIEDYSLQTNPHWSNSQELTTNTLTGLTEEPLRSEDRMQLRLLKRLLCGRLLKNSGKGMIDVCLEGECACWELQSFSVEKALWCNCSADHKYTLMSLQMMRLLEAQEGNFSWRENKLFVTRK